MASAERESMLSQQEKDTLQQNRISELEIELTGVQIQREIALRERCWTKLHGQQECASSDTIKMVLIGLGGVGKSTLGNVLVEPKEEHEFRASSSVSAETTDCKLATGIFKENNEDPGREIAVLDTPGYVIKKVLQSTGVEKKYKEPKTKAAIKKGIGLLGEGANVFVLVMNAADTRNFELELKLMEDAKLLNPTSLDYCMVVVTFSASNQDYKTRGIDAFLEHAKQSDIFSNFLKRIDYRVVLVELKCYNPTMNAAGMTTSFKEREQARQMVMHMAYVVMKRNVDCGILYEASKIEKDLEESCFSAKALVWTPNGEKLMEELRLNDGVLVANQQGQTQFEKVVMFSHAASNEVGCFLSISTEDRKVLRLSPGHLVHVGQVGQLKPARDVKAGDVMFTCGDGKQETGTVKSVKVTEVSNEWFTAGIYCPHTPSGSIIVDGVLASCYTDLMSPTLAHTLMFPVRTLHRVLPEDWFVWLMPYNTEQGMPKVVWSMRNMIPSRKN